MEDTLRALIDKHALDCYLVFNRDGHLNEYIRKRDMRVLEISGFSGSNGTIILSKDPCLVTDSRYYIQAEKESKFPLIKTGFLEYIAEKGYKKVSFDTRLVSSAMFKRIHEEFQKHGVEFVETEIEVDAEPEGEAGTIVHLEKYILRDFFCVPDGPSNDPRIINYLNSLGFSEFDVNVTGSHYQDKIQKIREGICEKTLVVAELDTISWILNLRGFDVEFNPVFFSFLVIDSNKVTLFCNHEIELEGVELRPYAEFYKHLEILADKPVLISGDCNQYIFSKFKDAQLISIVREYQTSKNETELCGMALAYFFDGLALTELFAFIQGSEGETEETVAEQLDRIKRRFKGYVQPSFGTISSTGRNAAIVHHHASSDGIDKNEVYLVDSGSQYYFGTTDTTRTLFFGSDDVPEELRHDYTLVLRGQLDAMMKVYTPESLYSEIDEISRSHLAAESKEFGHATGHGVGHFLCVHEHPPTIHAKSTEKIQPNQVFSIEPGYYKEGAYGIRIENLVTSRRTGDDINLVNITLVPYQNRMVDAVMLTAEEKAYYNECNDKCREVLTNYLSEGAREFLALNSGKLE